MERILSSQSCNIAWPFVSQETPNAVNATVSNTKIGSHELQPGSQPIWQMPKRMALTNITYPQILKTVFRCNFFGVGFPSLLVNKNKDMHIRSTKNKAVETL